MNKNNKAHPSESGDELRKQYEIGNEHRLSS